MELSIFENELQVVVEDNGLGFDYAREIKSGNVLGLKSILSRVTNLKVRGI
jgi:signal transduction histidine kinase